MGYLKNKADLKWEKNKHSSLNQFLRSREIYYYYAGPVPFSYLDYEARKQLHEFARQQKIMHGLDEKETIRQIKKILKTNRRKRKGAYADEEAN